jgi:hypothetical protein
MHRMMQSSGTAEGLRGLIDSSILKSLKKIIEWRALFGSSVVPIGEFQVLYSVKSAFVFLYIFLADLGEWADSHQHHGNVCAQRANIFTHHTRGGFT